MSLPRDSSLQRKVQSLKSQGHTNRQIAVLKLHGKAFSLKPMISSVVNFLKSAPPDELFLHGDLVAKLGFGPTYLQQRISDPALKPYTALIEGRKRYFGNPKAIAELRRQMGEK